jgi:hypothetical protein
MEETRTSGGCVSLTILGSLLALLAIADLLLGFELIPGFDLGGILLGLIKAAASVIDTLTSPF